VNLVPIKHMSNGKTANSATELSFLATIQTTCGWKDWGDRPWRECLAGGTSWRALSIDFSNIKSSLPN